MKIVITGSTATSDRVYDRLPEAYRVDDELRGFPLLRYLSTLTDQAGDLEDLVDRFDGDPTSDLVDPDTADNAWLDWLGQLVGVRLDPALTESERRDAVRFSSSGWQAGNKTAVADAAKTELTGTKFARVYDHSTAASVIGAASQWDVLIVTRPTETPNPAAVIEAVKRKRAKPAGVVLYQRSYESSWDTITTTYPTWNALEQAGSWNVIQEAGL